MFHFAFQFSKIVTILILLQQRSLLHSAPNLDTATRGINRCIFLHPAPPSPGRIAITFYSLIYDAAIVP